MAKNTDRGVEHTLAVDLLNSGDHRRIQGMFQIDPDIYRIGLIQPRLTHGEMDQLAAAQSTLEIFGTIDFVGLEVVVEGIDVCDLVHEIDI